MAELPTEIKRFAQVIRNEADAQQEQLIAQNQGRLPDTQPTNSTYRRGFLEGLKTAADLLDDGRGGS